MIIDANCYLGEGVGYSQSIDELIMEMDKNNVEKAVIVPVDKFIAVYNQEGNDYILKASKEYPGRFIPTATVNPWFGEKAIEELKRAFNNGARELNLHPFLQGFKISDEVVFPLVELAIEYKRPVYFHTGTPISGMPYQLTELAMRYPDCNFIMGHMGFSDFWNDVVFAASAVKNIYLETSNYYTTFIRTVVEQMGADKVLYGSGSPENSMNTEIEGIRKAIKYSHTRKLLFETVAKKIFKED
jgi:uncharacterized protein